MASDSTARPASLRVFNLAFLVFIGSIGLAIGGTLLLKFFPSTGPFFAPYMDALVNTPTWVYMALLPILSFALYYETLGLKRSVAFVLAGALAGAVAELVGTQTGFPFGEYAYTNRLGPKIMGHVPYFIPLSWYALSILCYDLARRMNMGVAGRIIGTAILMILWDVSLDPAMNQGGGTFVFWSYPSGGPYFGMPWVNWLGWFATSLLIGGAYELIGGLRSKPIAPVERWALILYAVNLLFPISICFLYGLPLAGAFGLAALLIPVTLLHFRKAESLAGSLSQ